MYKQAWVEEDTKYKTKDFFPKINSGMTPPKSIKHS